MALEEEREGERERREDTTRENYREVQVLDWAQWNRLTLRDG